MEYRNSTILQNNVTFILLISIFILNSSSTSNNVIITLLSLSLFLNFKSVKKYTFYKLLFLSGSLLSVIVGVIINNNNDVDLLRIGSLLLVVFSFPYKFNFNNKQYKLLILIGLYLFVLQVGNGLDIRLISNYVSALYPYELNVWNYGEISSVSDLSEIRFAGVFYNPNIMGQNMLLLFSCLLKFIKTNNNKIVIFIVFSIFFLSILLTGGRTAMFTFLIINYFAFRGYFIKTNFLLGIPLLLLIGLFYLPSIYTFISNFRVFDLGSTYTTDGSGSVKINILLDWLSQLFMDANFNLFEVVFGIGSIPTQFDFDFGYILQMFGVFGLVILIGFLVKIYHRTMQQYQFVFFLFLISIGATVIINFRYSILIFIILSMYNIDNKLQNEK